MAFTKAERKIISKLLDMASDEFSNNGCNDFDPVEQKLISKAEWKVLSEKMSLANSGEIEEGCEEQCKLDWWLMSYFSDRILEDE